MISYKDKTYCKGFDNQKICQECKDKLRQEDVDASIIAKLPIAMCQNKCNRFRLVNGKEKRVK